jgi:hypothetical protein
MLASWYIKCRMRHCIAILLFPLLLFPHCASKSPLEKEIRAFVGQEGIIPQDLFPVNISRGDAQKMIDSEYKLVVYLDSIALCSACWNRSLYVWRRERTINDSTPLLVIFNTYDIETVNRSMDIYFDKIPYFFDVDGKMKATPGFPTYESLKTFLTRRDTVLLTGSPVYNSKLMDLYIQTIVSGGTTN